MRNRGCGEQPVAFIHISFTLWPLGVMPQTTAMACLYPAESEGLQLQQHCD